MRVCPNCRQPLYEESKFCPHCGVSLEGKEVMAKGPPALDPSMKDLGPQGEGLGKAFTVLTSPAQKQRYVITGFILSAVGFFVASIPMGTATLVVGRILLRNQIKGWGYLFCLIGTAWAVGLPILNFLSLIQTSSISILPMLPKFLN
jgi:hypothetical protein